MAFKKELGLAAAMLAVTSCSELPPAPTSTTSIRNSLRLDALTTTTIEGIVGESVTPVPIVRVTNMAGRPMLGIAVSFELAGGGSIERSSTLTDADGSATVRSWTLGKVAGASTLTARLHSSATVTFTANAKQRVVMDSGSSGQLLYVQDGEIHTANLLTGDSWLLINGSSRRDFQPTWSPDGQRIAFARDMTKGGQLMMSGSELYLANADGTNVVLRAQGFHSPAWSPDGRLLAVTALDCIYRCEMYLLTVEDDGSAPLHIASEAAYPAWSPDGTKIAFVSLSGDDGYHELRVMNADGSNVTSITTRDEAAMYRPSWSPDGLRIAFPKCAHGACSIYTVNSDGSALTQLTTAGDALGPAWSPDGTRIAFSLSGIGVVYLPANGGSDPVLMIPSGHSPAWRPSAH